MNNNSNGILLFARNNGELDYVKQAVYSAKRIKKYLDVPVSVVTDSVDYLKNSFDSSIFDKIVSIPYENPANKRRYHDGTLSHKILNFKNNLRFQSYDLSPYDKTIVMDTDYIICNDKLKYCFDSSSDLMLFKKSEDIAKVRNETEFQRTSDPGIDFYWATVVYFTKSEPNKIFFDLIEFISKNWEYYRRLYQIDDALFRNDYAFSIAVHIMNGFSSGDFVTEFPIKHLYTIDKDILWDVKDDKLTFLVEKKNYLGEYTAITTRGLNVHAMNKFSLERVINKELHNE